MTHSIRNLGFIKTALTAGVACLVVGVFLSITPIVLAQQQESVTICHATASNSHPYSTESPNIQNDGSLTGGHLDHTGPVYPTDGWGDIIPPYQHGNFSYPGMNWTADGQTIWNNGCSMSSPTPTAGPTSSPTPTTDPVTPTPTTAPTTAPTSAPSNSDSGSSSNDNNSSSSYSSSGSVDAASTEQGQVLGTSTMAKTGSATQNFSILLMAIGILTTGASTVLYAKVSRETA